jgi:uncharacterized protein YjbI with pentapeptide repeats
MKIESEKHPMDVREANLAGANIANARLDGATIDGIALTNLLAYWRAGREAKSA